MSFCLSVHAKVSLAKVSFWPKCDSATHTGTSDDTHVTHHFQRKKGLPMRHYCLSIAHLLQSLLVLRGHETWLNHGVGGEQPLEHQSHEFDIIQNKAHF